MPRKVGPGDVVLNGDQVIDEVVANTNLTVVDGQLTVGMMRDNVSVKTQKSTATIPLNIEVIHILGTGNIDADGNVVIRKPFKDRVHVSASDIIQANAIGNASVLTSKTNAIHVECVGDACQLTAAEEIDAERVGSYSQLTSQQGGIVVRSLGNNCLANAEKSLYVKESVGVASVLNSNADVIFVVCDIGANAAVQAKKSIVCKGNVHPNGALASQTDEIKVTGVVSDGVALRADKKLTVGGGVGVLAALQSNNDVIQVYGTIETQAALKALKGIEIRGELEQGVEVLATNGPILLDGIVGSESILEGVGLIKIKGLIQDKANILCNDGSDGVSKIEVLGKVKNSALLTADQVYINGVLQTLNAEKVKTNVVNLKKDHHSFWAKKHEAISSNIEHQSPVFKS